MCIFFVTLIINLSFFTNQTVFYAKPQAHVNRAHPLCNLKILSWPQFIFRKACPFLLCICCPFLDVLSCFVTLRGAQYLFGSAACPILYSAKVKQQLWPAKELRISFIFLFFLRGRVKAGREATSARSSEGKWIFFWEYQSSASFPHCGVQHVGMELRSEDASSGSGCRRAALTQSGCFTGILQEIPLTGLCTREEALRRGNHCKTAWVPLNQRHPSCFRLSLWCIFLPPPPDLRLSPSQPFLLCVGL